MADNKNNGTNEEFDDQAFDIDDVAEEDYDEAAFDEDLVDDEADISADDLDEEWQNEEQPAAVNKKTGSTGKNGLSFNTMVIIGAVILGAGVLIFNVMSKTADQQAAQGSQFRSMIDITGILDGTLFGSNPENQKPAEDQPQDNGFLESLDAGTPPQPAPITPVEENARDAVPPDALTPMPAPEIAQTVESIPRNPDETPPPPAQTAADILDRAKELREQKAEENVKAVAKVAQDIPVVQMEAPAEPAPVLAPSAPATPAQAVVQSVNPDNGAEGGIVQLLEEKIGEVLNRMGAIEENLADVRESQKSDYKKLEERIASMQGDLDGLKNRPVNVTLPSSDDKPATKPVVKKIKKATPPEDKAYSPPRPSVPVGVAAAPAATPVVWELRAAQPGRAWVSRHGSKDMQGVVVGDNLPGIGQVTAITYQNGRWTVQGTKGQVLQ